jgi:predicted nucleotidyltransferase
MKLSEEQRKGILTMLAWVDGFEEIYLRKDRVRDRLVIKDGLLKVLLLDEYDKVDRELLNDLRKEYLKNLKVG